ncbi:MAG: cation:proton antiporter [Candidatus Omnitrophica bacterium]|nr:cation:proton antiporter [Candidatus Omnitrophota bacterium]
MEVLSEHAVFIFIAELGIIILAARIFGEIAGRLGQPVIVGEVLAGIILGPSIFGKFLPEWRHTLFPETGPHPYLLQGISWLCVIFLLLITGLEIDFRASLRQGKQSIYISLLALIFSFSGVFLITPFLPDFLYPPDVNPTHINLMLSLALSVVAIPVIAKILFDLKILRSEVGLKVLTSGILSDVWGWSLLAVLIALIAQGNLTPLTVIKPLVTMVLYLGITLSVGQKAFDKFLDAIGYKEMTTTTILALVFALALINGALAHLLGIHVIFGAFIAGILAGESEKVTPYIRQWIQEFIFAVFAPIFFVLIGMQLQFDTITSWWPVILLLSVSSVSKIGGAYLGAVLGGLGRKNALAVACGLNTQGTMGIIVALIGYEMGILNEAMFSVIIVICIFTSLGVGPLLKWAIKGVRRPLAKYFDRDHVFFDVEGETKEEIIENLTKLMAKRKLISEPEKVQEAIWHREQTLSTAIGEGVAVPHARLDNLNAPVLCFFRLHSPVDFGSPDNKPVQLLFLELTDSNDDGMQLNLIAQVARFISSAENRNRLLNCTHEEEVHHILSFDETI